MRQGASCGMLRGASSRKHMQGGGCAVVRQAHLIAVVGTFLIGCAVLLAVGCAGVRSEAPKEKQGQAEDAKARTNTTLTSLTMWIAVARWEGAEVQMPRGAPAD